MCLMQCSTSPVCCLELVPLSVLKAEHASHQLAVLLQSPFTDVWRPEKFCLVVAACFNTSNLQKRPLHLQAASGFHVFPIRRTSVQSAFRESLRQPTRPIQYTTRNHHRSLFSFLPRKVHQPCSSPTFYTNRSIFRRRIEAT